MLKEKNNINFLNKTGFSLITNYASGGVSNNPQVEALLALQPQVAAIGITNIHDGNYIMFQPDGEPVTKKGQSVTFLKNLGSDGGWFAAEAGEEPIWRGEAGLEFDGTDSNLVFTSLTISQPFSIVAGIKETSTAPSANKDFVRNSAGGGGLVTLIRRFSGTSNIALNAGTSLTIYNPEFDNYNAYIAVADGSGSTFQIGEDSVTGNAGTNQMGNGLRLQPLGGTPTFYTFVGRFTRGLSTNEVAILKDILGK